MGLESIDFQSLIHQQISVLMDSWRSAGLNETELQETASQFFNMGLIASQQVQQEGGIQPEGSPQKVLYDENTATKVVSQFLEGLSFALIKAQEQRLPNQERWQIMQEVAFHVFEQSKQAIIATMGQELTPEIQISKEQITAWLSQTATEAFLYYLQEYEKQHGPITRSGDDLLLASLEENPLQSEFDTELDNSAVAGIQAPITQALPEVHHKYAAIGLLLGSLSYQKQQNILSAFKPEEQQIINQYRNPDIVAASLDLNRVAQYLKHFKEKIGLGGPKQTERHSAAPLVRAIQMIPPQRLERLFQQERPMIRGYIRQYLATSNQSFDTYHLPPGVEESLLPYLQRNFPELAGVR